MTKNIDTATIGGRIKYCRIKQELSQEELAEMLFTTKQMISAYENEKVELKCNMLLDFAKSLNVSASYLLEGRVDQAPENKQLSELMRTFLELGDAKLQAVALAQIMALAQL